MITVNNACLAADALHERGKHEPSSVREGRLQIPGRGRNHRSRRVPRAAFATVGTSLLPASSGATVGHRLYRTRQPCLNCGIRTIAPTGTRVPPIDRGTRRGVAATVCRQFRTRT